MWHTLSPDEVLKQMKTDPTAGLSSAEVLLRQKEHGKNVLPRGNEKHWWNFLLRQFKSPLVYILIIGALLSAWLHEWVDVGVIFLAVLLNIAVGFFVVYHFLGAFVDLAAHLNDPLTAEYARLFVRFRIEWKRYHLHFAGDVAQIDEDEFPVIAANINPSCDSDFAVNMFVKFFCACSCHINRVKRQFSAVSPASWVLRQHAPLCPLLGE